MIPVRTRRLLLWIALPALILVLLYTLLGFYLVPHLIRSGVHDFVTKNYHRDVTLGDVRFNPYTLRLDVRDFALPDTDGQPMLAFRHLLVDLTVASVWRLGPDFETILLEQPFTRVQVKHDGTLNLADLALPPSPEAKPEPKGKPLRLFINRFTVQGGNLAFEDLSHASPFHTEIKPITFDLRHFSTVGKEDGAYALSGASEAGERFSWSGSLSPAPLASHGQFKVENLLAQTIWSYLRDSVHFELPSGAVSIAGDYDFTTATAPMGLAVNVREATVSDLGIRPTGVANDYIKIARLEVHDTRADVARHTVDVGSVRLAGGELQVWMPGAHGEVLNLMELVGPPAAGTTGTPPSPAAGEKAGEKSPTSVSGGASPDAGGGQSPSTWVVSLPDIALDGLKINAEDRHAAPTVVMHLSDLALHVNGYTTSRANPIAVTLSTKINQGKLEAKADVSPDFNTMKVHADLADLDLTAFQPYIAQQTSMTLRNGMLSTKLDADRAADGHIAVTGEVNVAKLRTIDNELKRDFIKFEHLQVTGLDYQANLNDTSKPASLHIRNVMARSPYARVMIEPDQTTNVGRVLRLKKSTSNAAPSATPASATATASASASANATVAPGASATATSATATSAASAPAASAPAASAPAASAPAASAPAASAPAASAPAASAPAASAPAASASAAPPQFTSATAEPESPSSTNTRKSAAPASTSAPTASTSPPGRKGRAHGKHGKSTPAEPVPETESGMVIAIDAIDIKDGSANYADLWIQPHFAIGIQMLNGYVRGLSSNPRAKAKVDLEGRVDRYAPISISGETNPLIATAYTDIKMSFKGVELSSVTPYSGRFAGYKIEKGKLSADINYKIDNRKLSANHKFVINQLELGEKVDSPDAVKLPLKIAIALLKDRNGVIDLDLPVSGSLDDPQFKLGPIIWKAVLNLLTKIATAPFAMLGHLFGGGEQMNYIDFPPGSAVLAPSEHDKLVALVKALKEKEKLELDVPITYAPDLDKPALASAHLNARLLELKEEQGSGKHRKSDLQKVSTQSTSTPVEGSKPDGQSTPREVPDGSPPPSSAIMDAPPPSDPALLDPPQRYKLLLALYRIELGKSTPLPDAVHTIESAGKKKDQPPPDFGAANAALEAALVQKKPVPDSELEVLGKHRARAIQEVLLMGTDLDPGRVFLIGTAPKAPAEKDKVRVELALK